MDRVHLNMWTEQKGGQGSPKHGDRAKGWAGFAKTIVEQKKRVGRARKKGDIAKGWKGSHTHGQSLGWTGFAYTWT